jgi:hypothetical protein
MTNDKALRQAIIPLFYIGRFNDPCAVTLTMKQRVNSRELDQIECSRNFRHFSNRLNKVGFGNAFTRYGNRLRMIPVLEKSNSQRYHYHTALDRIDRISRDQFKDIVTDCWERTLWGYREIDFQYDISNGWIDYITKPSQKETYSDSIDWQNFYCPIAE